MVTERHKEDIITYWDIFQIFGKVSTEEQEALIKEANAICEEFGVSADYLVEQAKRIKNNDAQCSTPYFEIRVRKFCNRM